MKREILCKFCKFEIRKLFPTDTPYPQEHVKFVNGHAKQDFICDSCGTEISKSDPCTAFSSWAEYGGIQYYEWEYEFISQTHG